MIFSGDMVTGTASPTIHRRNSTWVWRKRTRLMRMQRPGYATGIARSAFGTSAARGPRSTSGILTGPRTGFKTEATGYIAFSSTWAAIEHAHAPATCFCHFASNFWRSFFSVAETSSETIPKGTFGWSPRIKSFVLHQLLRKIVSMHEG